MNHQQDDTVVVRSLPEMRGTLGSLLRTASDALSQEVYYRLPQAGFANIRPAHSSVFRHIPPQGARTVDLADRAGMRKQSMGYLLDDLQALGYVSEEPDPTDGRARIARLTERGLAAQETLVRLSGEVEAVWAQRLGAKGWATTRRTLEGLAEMLEAESQREGRR